MRYQKALPQSGALMVDGEGRPSQAWWRFFSLQFSKPPAASGVTVGASPYTYNATQDGSVTINGGTVSAIALVRGGSSYTTGVTAGQLSLRNGDAVQITYTVAPTVTFFPD